MRGSDFTDLQASVMKNGLEGLREAYPVMSKKQPEKQLGLLEIDEVRTDKIKLTICLLIGHPDCSDALIGNTNLIDPGILLEAAGNLGRVDMIEPILTKSSVEPQAIRMAFVNACAEGHLTCATQLWPWVSRTIKEYNSFNNALLFAAKNSHFDVINWYITQLLPGEKESILQTGSYAIFRRAAGDGNLVLLKWLIEQLPQERQYMLQADGYAGFNWAYRSQHPDCCNYLLTFPEMLAHAESHEHEYSNIIHPFINSQLQVLREQKAAFETKNPHAAFDVNEERAKLCFYILRNLIRQNPLEARDDILFLLSIPAVKALAHTEVTPHQSNELLRLALTLENQTAANILLDIPAVRALAEQNNFYQNERRGQLDLRASAQDLESSMHALSPSEEKRLQKVIEHYTPIINTHGVNPLFQALIDTLKTRYNAHPAVLKTGDGREIELPLAWEDWKKLEKTLSADTRESGLQAYAQHTDHTALRYLSKPNPWMTPNAELVNRDSTGAWSTFEEYKSEITLLWLAASDVSTDKTVAPVDNFTVATRIDHFIHELAYLGRAHNWDNTRIKLDPQGNEVTEEYDDLQGDKPSCYSGVKRRLFQSVMGHPMLKLLTMDIIKQEMRDFARQYIQHIITDENRDAIRHAWETLCSADPLTEDQKKSLALLNIPEEKQALLINTLAQKYPGQFEDFRHDVENSFKLSAKFEYHAVRFAPEINLDGLLKAPITLANLHTIFHSTIFQAKSILNTCGNSGAAIINEINHLNRSGSTNKLNRLLAAINALPNNLSEASLCETLHNSESNLSKALAIPLLAHDDSKFLREILECAAMSPAFKRK